MDRQDPKDTDLVLAGQLAELVTASWKSQILCVAAQLRIADLLAEGPRTSEDLAEVIGAHAPSLRRLLRGLATLGLCSQCKNGTFSITPLGSLLAETSPLSLRSWAIWWGTNLWQPWGNLLYSVRTGQGARRMLTGKKGFEHLSDDPEAAAIFNQGLVELTRLVADSVVRSYDFSVLRKIVDIGGGYGELLMAILKAHPLASGTVFDLPHAIESAKLRFAQAGLASRCDFCVGDFFEFVPAGADAYLLKSVIHDWDDTQSRLILEKCRAAMGRAGRLLLIDQIMPDEVEASSEHQRLMRSDLNMLVAHGGQERTMGEFLDLLAAAGLRVSRILPTSSTFSVIEAVPA